MESTINAVAYVILAALYFAPVLVAVSRRHYNAPAICITALLFGWTVVGWAVALVWSFTNPPPGTASAGAPAALQAGAKTPAGPAVKVARFVGWAAAAFVLVIFLMVVYAKVTGNGTALPPETSGAPAPNAGVPLPAEELFGE